ncbi:MAG: porin [Thermoguttaceae bacterium]
MVDVQSLIHRLDALDTRIRELESQLQTQGEFLERLPAVPIGNQNVTPRFASLATAAAEPEAEAPAWVDVSSEKWKMKFGGEIQGDYVMYAHQDAANRAEYGNIPNYYEFRRLRFWVAGTGYGVYDFKFQLDFEPENTFTVRNAAGTGTTTIAAAGVGMRDMYIGIHEIPVLGYVRFGQYYEPFGLEQNTSDKYVTFMERSLPVIFARDRQVGITAYNQSESESLIWAAGAFLPAIDATEKQRVADDQGVDVVLRSVWTPWYESDGRYLLHLGGGYVFTKVTDQTARFRSRPEVHESTTFLDTGSFGADTIHRGNVEAALVRGPLSLQSEFYVVHTNGIGGTPDMDFYGAYAFVSYFLTGEHRGYRRSQGVFHRVTPYTNFFVVNTPRGCQAGWGAWEAIARWSFLDLDEPGLTSDTRGQLHDLTLGLTWYWTPHAKMMFNWIHAFNDIASVGRNEADIIGTRIQLEF